MSKHKLLLADDSITIQKVVNLTFADEGVEVISVGDGDAALEKLGEFTPDLVMVDINMPGLSGYEICERIRANEATRRTPVILLVGSFEPFDEEEARRVGANDFLTKPFQSIRQLVTKVSGLLEAKKSSTDEIISDLETPETGAMPGEFEDTLKIEAEESAPEEFGDAGLDDEMIQTNQVGGFGADEVQNLQSDTQDVGKTQPLSTAELDEIRGFQPSSEEERGYAFVGETPFAESAETATLAETEPLPQSDSFYQIQEVAPTPAILETEENLLELPPQERLSAAALSQPVWQEEMAETSETPQIESDDVVQETASETTEAVEETQPEVEEKTVEEAAPIENVADEADIREIPTDEMIDTSAIESGAAAQAVNLSPEVIEAIAAKVSERFSDRVIREIVAEITPQITELIAKRITEEEK